MSVPGHVVSSAHTIRASASTAVLTTTLSPNRYAAHVPDDLPWEEYRRNRPRHGMSFPIGRDLIEQALRDANAIIGTLELVVPDYGGHPAPADPLAVTVDWFSDAQSGYLSNRNRSEASHLLMRVWAVPADHRHQLRIPASDGVALACRWAAEARERGTAWSASNHSLMLRYQHDLLTWEES